MIKRIFLLAVLVLLTVGYVYANPPTQDLKKTFNWSSMKAGGPVILQNGNKYIIAWIESSSGKINIAMSTDGFNFSKVKKLEYNTDSRPALAFFKSKFYIAWVDTSDVNTAHNRFVYIMTSDDGKNWSKREKITYGSPYYGGMNSVTVQSYSGPALAEFDGKLYLTWTSIKPVGKPRNINIISTKDGLQWKNYKKFDETTKKTPALASFPSFLALAWKGSDVQCRLNILASGNGTFEDAEKLTLTEITDSAPSMVYQVEKEGMYLAWQGKGNKWLNLMRFPYDDTFNANEKREKTIIREEACEGGPAIAPVGNKLVIVWTGTDANHSLNVKVLNNY